MRKIAGALVLLTLALSVGAQVPEPQDRFTLPSRIMEETRTVVVRVPASYRTSERRYPVLYLTDGDHHIGHTAATVDFLAREGRMPEAITVAVVNTDRQRDLAPAKAADRQGRLGADRFLDFFEKELIPAVDSRYRTTPYRVFGGHSRGGLFALHGLFTRPKLFDAWIAVSPTFGWDERYLFRRANEFFDKLPKDFATTVVITVGDEGEAVRTAFDEYRRLIEKRAPKGFDATFVHFPDEDHGSVVMPSHYAALRKVFGPFRFVIAEGADLKQEFARAGEHYAQLSKRLGYEILPPENLVNIIGYRLLQADRTADAIAVFQANVNHWPRSANVYDSLGEAYEKGGQRAEALANYEMAVKIGSETKDANLPIFQQNAERVR